MFYDITFHQLGSFHEDKVLRCGLNNATLNQQHLTTREAFLGQSCIHGLMSGRVLQCEVPGGENYLCEAVLEHLHDFLIICITRLCMCFSVVSSLINPFIHGLWYPGFRQAVLYLRNR